MTTIPHAPVHSRRPASEAATTCVEGGMVLVDGPDGLALTLTPDAAFELSRRLEQAAREASAPADEPGACI